MGRASYEGHDHCSNAAVLVAPRNKFASPRLRNAVKTLDPTQKGTDAKRDAKNLREISAPIFGTLLALARDSVTRDDPDTGPDMGACELLTVTELARRLKVDRRTVYKLRALGLPTIMVVSSVRFYWPEVLAWLKSRGKEDKAA